LRNPVADDSGSELFLWQRYNLVMPGDAKKYFRAFWIFAIGFALLAIAAVARLRTPSEKVPWRTDYTAGMAEASMTNKKVLLDFSATWCEPCQEMKRTTWSDTGVARALAAEVPISVDPDKHPELVAKYHVQAFPTMILLSSTGILINETEGSLRPDEFLEWLHSPPLR
jgi:thiol:disulfide interchange protein